MDIDMIYNNIDIYLYDKFLFYCFFRLTFIYMIYYNIDIHQCDKYNGERMDKHELQQILKALSDETRLKIFSMLKDKELCGYLILDKLQITQPTLSYHMKILCDCGLVEYKKDWKWMYYTQNKTKIKDLTYILENMI